VCDPAKPYADTATVMLILDRVGASVGGARPGAAGHNLRNWQTGQTSSGSHKDAPGKGEPQAGVGTMGEVSEVGHGGGGKDPECYLVVKTEQQTWHAPHALSILVLYYSRA